MKPKYNETIRKLLLEIKELTKDLPQGRRNKISNRLDKINSTIKKIQSYERRQVNCKTDSRQVYC